VSVPVPVGMRSRASGAARLDGGNSRTQVVRSQELQECRRRKRTGWKPMLLWASVTCGWGVRKVA